MAKAIDSFRKNLIAQRRRLRLTQQGLADLAGVSLQSIWKFENGEAWPRIETVRKLAEVFGIEESDLFVADLPPPADHDIQECYARVKAKIDEPSPVEVLKRVREILLDAGVALPNGLPELDRAVGTSKTDRK